MFAPRIFERASRIGDECGLKYNNRSAIKGNIIYVVREEYFSRHWLDQKYSFDL